LMMFAAAGQAVCMAVLAGTVSTGQPGPGIVAIVMLFLFSKSSPENDMDIANSMIDFFFAVGLLAIPWLCKSTPPSVSQPSPTNRVQYPPNMLPWPSVPVLPPLPQPPTGSSPSSSSR
jgi:hypothetical protein